MEINNKEQKNKTKKRETEEFKIPTKAELKKRKENNNKEKDNKFNAGEIKKKINFHVMPAKFRLNQKSAQDARKTGVIIMVFGVLFLIVLSILLYIFFFKEKDDGNNELINNLDNEKIPYIAEKEIKPEIDEKLQKDSSASSSPESSKLAEKEDDNKESNATSTPELVATSTPELAATSTPNSELNIDMDNDGLSNKEELVFGISDTNIDSDGDSYNDIIELENLYNPAGEGMLVDNQNISKYRNNYYDYKFLYPLLWEKINVGGDDTVMLNSDDGHFIQIIAQDNLRKQAIEEWLTEQLGEDAVDLDKRQEKEEWTGIKHIDNHIIYITDKNKKNIFVISYSFEADSLPIYKNIYNMIVNSFDIGN